MGSKQQDAKSQEEILIKAYQALINYPGSIFTHIDLVLTAERPAIQLHHTASHLDCDISFKNGLGIESAQFLR